MSNFTIFRCKNCNHSLTLRVGNRDIKPYMHASTTYRTCHCGCNNPEPLNNELNYNKEMKTWLNLTKN